MLTVQVKLNGAIGVWILKFYLMQTDIHTGHHFNIRLGKAAQCTQFK